jgi:hypothetical protein
MMLEQLTRGEQQAKAVLMPVSLAIRQSTGPPPGDAAPADGAARAEPRQASREPSRDAIV